MKLLKKIQLSACGGARRAATTKNQQRIEMSVTASPIKECKGIWAGCSWIRDAWIKGAMCV